MRIVPFVRGLVALTLFGVFGAGALLITPLMLVLRRPERCQPIVRTCWRIELLLFGLMRMVRVERGNLGPVRGAVIAANHPSLIDVVILTALIPRTLYVAKHGLLANPFVSAIVRATALPDDASLPAAAAGYLADGWNVLVFPEGTRSPQDGGLRPLRRGAAQLVLRTGAPLVCVRMSVSRRLLAKHQRPWDMGERCVTYTLNVKPLEAIRREDETPHHAAVRVTEDMGRLLSA